MAFWEACWVSLGTPGRTLLGSLPLPLLQYLMRLVLVGTVAGEHLELLSPSLQIQLDAHHFEGEQGAISAACPGSPLPAASLPTCILGIHLLASGYDHPG